MPLNKVQGDFMAYLYSLRPPDDLHRRVRALFNGSDTPDPEKGLNTYRRNLVFGLIGALKETYPFCAALLGENNFNFFCREYIYQNPSTNPDLMEYGSAFADFLQARPECGDWPFMPDIARLEWAKDRVFYSEPVFGDKPVSKFSGMKVQVNNALRVVKTSYGVYKPWAQFEEGGLDNLQDKPFHPKEEWLVVWSEEGTPQVEPVEAMMGEILEGLENGNFAGAGPDESPFLENLEFIFQRGWAQG